MTAKEMDTFLLGLKAILDVELTPMRERLTMLEAENRALRARLNATTRLPRPVPVQRRA